MEFKVKFIRVKCIMIQFENDLLYGILKVLYHATNPFIVNNSNSKDNSENHSCIQIVPQYALCNHSYHNDKKHCDMSFTALFMALHGEHVIASTAEIR